MPNIISFQFGNREVRIEIDEAGNPWWIAKDVCEVLGLTKVDRALARLKPEEKATHLMSTPGGMQMMSAVTESGLYRLIFRSDKPEAQHFQAWVFEDVLPSIRKTGRYDVVQNTGGPLVQLAIAHEKLERQQQKQQQELLQAQQDIIALQRSELETKEHALLAIHSMQWVTIRQYVQIYDLARQMPAPVQRSYSIWLTTYCLDRGLAMYKAATADKQWPNEKTYCITAIQQTLPGWLQRHGNRDQSTLDEETR